MRLTETCLLTPAEFQKRISVSNTTLNDWRRAGVLLPTRDYLWLPGKDGRVTKAPRNLRYKWPQAMEAVTAGVRVAERTEAVRLGYGG